MQEERGKGGHLIIFTRALGRGARVYALGKCRGNTREMWPRIQRKEKKDRVKGNKEDGVRGNIRFMK